MASGNSASVPESPAPTDLGAGSWWDALKRAAKEAQADKVTDWAAAMTYYSVLALFPASIVLVSLIGVVGDPRETTQGVLDVVTDLAPGVTDVIQEPLEQLAGRPATAATLLSVGLLGALWSASGYVGAFMRAMNVVYDVEEGRPLWKLRPLQLLITIVGLIVAAVVATGLVLSGPVAESVGNALGVGDTFLTVWNVAKWPVMLIVAGIGLAVLYWATPNVEHPKLRWLTPGSFLALLLWALLSLGFGFYAANFGSYNRTYGSLGAVVIFLVWLWLTNLALLLGAEFDAELERVRQLKAGLPAEPDLQLPQREPS